MGTRQCDLRTKVPSLEIIKRCRFDSRGYCCRARLQAGTITLTGVRSFPLPGGGDVGRSVVRAGSTYFAPWPRARARDEIIPLLNLRGGGSLNLYLAGTPPPLESDSPRNRDPIGAVFGGGVAIRGCRSGQPITGGGGGLLKFFIDSIHSEFHSINFYAWYYSDILLVVLLSHRLTSIIFRRDSDETIIDSFVTLWPMIFFHCDRTRPVIT